MAVEIRIPTLGESVSEAVVAAWLKKDGEYVEKGEAVVELETDKVNSELTAPESGVLRVTAAEGSTLRIGDLVGGVEPGAKPAGNGAAAPPAPGASAPAAPQAAVKASPVARKVAAEHGVNIAAVPGQGHGGRVMREDVVTFVEKARQPDVAVASSAPAPAAPSKAPVAAPGQRLVTRERMTQIRKRIAQRLIDSQQGTATLTTFQECDMSAVMEIRRKYNESYQKKHGIKLGMMSFFVKASIEALRAFPRVNAYMEGEEIVYHHYYDIGVAVGTDRGLVVPIVRNAETLSFGEIELTIKDLADRGRAGKLTLEEMTGGTFTVSNGGVYGSMLSTPILNPPQSGILGMHNIVDRPVAVNGQVVIRPVMFLAFSYDHRMIDGTESVQFLKRIKECIEAPERMLLDI